MFIRGQINLALLSAVLIARAVFGDEGSRLAPPAFSLVPAADVQPGGPLHDFLISRTEVRNDAFAEFLNNALANPGNERGAYLYFDIDSGDVFLHHQEHGAAGTTGSGTALFIASRNRHLTFDPLLMEYVVSADGADHPVTGVSWFGAVKYCNWLTLVNGLGAGERAYSEAASPNVSGWHPVTISTSGWAVRDLNDAERLSLLNIPGFRLPMDGGDDGTDPGVFNEWYKAAAWDARAQRNRAYGFGRDTIADVDSNFRCSHDPFEDAADCTLGNTTPVGFFDGRLHSSGFLSRAEANAFGLFDASGNVWEWMQDQSFLPADRRNRGGSYRNSADALRVIIRAERAADGTSDSTGFRVAAVHPVAGGIVIWPPAEVKRQGVWGGPYDQGGSFVEYRIANVSQAPIEVEATTSQPWLALSTSLPVLLLPGESNMLTARAIADCDFGLLVGENVGIISFTSSAYGAETRRRVSVTNSEPLGLQPSTGLQATGPFGFPPDSGGIVLSISNFSDSIVSWSATAVERSFSSNSEVPAEWLTLNGGADAHGDLPAHGTDSLLVQFDPDHSAGLSVGTHTADVRVKDECTGTVFTRTIALDVVAPFEVSAIDGVEFSGPCNGPFAPDFHRIRLRNPNVRRVQWSVAVDRPDLLTVDQFAGSLSGTEETTVELRLGDGVFGLPAGRQLVAVSLVEPLTQYTVDLEFIVEVRPTNVLPDMEAEFSGASGGAFFPSSFVYSLLNDGVEELEWTATFHETSKSSSGSSWLTISPDSGTILNPNGSAAIAVRPSESAESLSPGTYSGEIIFLTAQGAECGARRSVRLRIGGESFSVPMVWVPGSDVQTGGPTHDFRMGQFEITNEQFARFLNDAWRNADHARGEFLNHGDPPTGTVRLTGDGTAVFQASIGGAIQWRDARYEVMPGLEHHPVVGVSWFGAAKFCNWMTLIQGMGGPPDQRCYLEGPTRSDWRAARPTRSELVQELRGFRLPMDGESTVVSTFNEWHKAAAMKGRAGDGIAQFGAAYGFGRDAITSGDANYLDNGDLPANGLTPVGFFDGVSRLSGSNGLTNDTGNGYRLYDLCGNAAEWAHDIGVTDGEQAVRGGHFNSAGNSPHLRNDGRTSQPADGTFSFVGFRVLQVLEPAELTVTQSGTHAHGFVGGPYSAEEFRLRIENPNPRLTVEPIFVEVLAPADLWLEIDGVAPSQAPPRSVIDVNVRIQPSIEHPGMSPLESNGFSLVAGETSKGTNGPLHDYWVGQTEVTNRQFADFLNAARSNALAGSAADERSEYMYFDRDSGDVFVHNLRQGEEGTVAPSGTVTTRMYCASVGRIRFSNNRFEVETGFEEHPVVGVSWYGAIKYCNWLTLTQGFSGARPAYVEATGDDLGGWRPVETDRGRFAAEVLGYRLPMDDESDGPSAFNEWFKAAATPSDDEKSASTEVVFGFGRESLTPQDANYWHSGDTAEDGTTPVRFFDGMQFLFHQETDCIPPLTFPQQTNDSNNRYGLHDLCGNVSEWTQDFGATAAERSTRGGSWRDSAGSVFLTNSARRSVRADSTRDDVGFRVVRGAGHEATIVITERLREEAQNIASFVLDLREPFLVSNMRDIKFTLRYGNEPTGAGVASDIATLTNRSESRLPWEVESSRSWLTVEDTDSQLQAGEIESGAVLAFRAFANSEANKLHPGVHETEITIRNPATQQSWVRTFQLEILPPLQVAPHEKIIARGYWGGPFAFLEPGVEVSFVNLAPFPLHYQISTDEPWLVLTPSEQLSGTLQPTGAMGSGDRVSVGAEIGMAAALLNVGEWSANVRISLLDARNSRDAGMLSTRVTLHVDDPVEVVSPAASWFIGPILDSGSLPQQEFELWNHSTAPIDVHLASDQAWVEWESAFLELIPNQSTPVVARLNASALELFDGRHEAVLSVEDARTGVVQCRQVTLVVEEALSVDPFSDFFAAGVAGGPITPSGRTYRLTNVARDAGGPMTWRANVRTPGVDWIRLNGESSATGTLLDGESALLAVTIDGASTLSLSEGDQGPVIIEFSDITSDQPIALQERQVFLSLVVPSFSLEEVVVSATTTQPGGPAYGYRMSRYLVTNAEFVAFLNDATANTSNARGQHVFLDSVTGDLYADYPGAGRLLFSPGSSGRIQLLAGKYRLAAGSEDYARHPVAGVSWHGAVKYCNWLTIDQGMLPEEQCYRESETGDLSEWRPAAIGHEDWLERDLNDAERASLVRHTRGFRLAMDDGYNNSNASVDTPDGFNEWYKAAAWNAALRRNVQYAFGRDVLTEIDANFRDSGDLYDNGTTPVGHYDAVNANSFGLSDMSGNVYEWMQDRYSAHSGGIQFRTIRGGSWNDAASSANLRASARTFTLATMIHPEIGFRVVRAAPDATGDFDRDGDVDAVDLARLLEGLRGPSLSLYPEWSIFDFDGDGDLDLCDIAAFQRRFQPG